MLFGLIISILSATFSVSSTTTVEASGDIPAYATHHYARSAESGQKGQMTAGNSTCLTLSGWDGCTIQSIDLEMRSNKSSGTGSLLVAVGQENVWEISNQSFAHTDWYGAYSDEWVNIHHDINCQVQDDEQINIIISATENSLYIKSYTIHYEPAAPSVYTVEFITGFDSVPAAITQTEIGAPILLPEWTDSLDWYFLGWTTIDIEESTQCPELLPAGNMFTPIKDTRLWAIYTDNNNNYATSECISGEYVVAQFNELTEGISGQGMGWAIYGKIYNEAISLKPLAIAYNDTLLQLQQDISIDMAYVITFLSDSTLSIRHSKSGENIGYQANALAAKESVWNYRILDDGTLGIYYTYNNKSYALWFGFGPQSTNTTAIAYIQQIALDAWIGDGICLFPAVVSTYTSWPCGKWNALEKTEVQPPLSSDYIIHFGQYQLHIKDGKKYIFLVP